MLLGPPALEYAPQQQKYQDTFPNLRKAIQDWTNTLTNEFVPNLKKAHPDVTASVFSTAVVFEKIMQNPKSYTQTAGLKVLGSDYCAAYAKYVFVDNAASKLS